MILDFSSLKTCNLTLSKLITIPLEEIHNHSSFENIYSGNDWVRPYINSIIFNDISKLAITLFHTTTLNNPNEIIDNGILTLPNVLSSNTFLHTFFKRQNISFDIPEKKIIFCNEPYSLEVNSNDRLFLISNRIYNDSNVNGFYFNTVGTSNYSVIDDAPEFLVNTIEKFYSAHETKLIIDNWKHNTSTYIVKTIVPLTKIDLDIDFQYKIVSKLIDIYLTDSEELIPDDRYIVYVKRDVNVLPEEIISVNKL